MKEDIIIGRNPVLEALRADVEFDKIYVLKDATGPLGQIISLAKKKRIVITECPRNKMNTMADGENHQGVIGICPVQSYASVEDILAKAEEKGEEPFIIIADNINDPHNLGAIIRTANCVGAHGVIIPKHRSVGMGSTVAKTSAGATAYTLVAKVTNIAKTIDMLKDKGLWITGADMDGDETIYTANLKGAIGLVIGSEGEGISRLVREKCDFMMSIPMSGEINSLNASVAGGIMMYEIYRQRNIKK